MCKHVSTSYQKVCVAWQPSHQLKELSEVEVVTDFLQAEDTSHISINILII